MSCKKAMYPSSMNFSSVIFALFLTVRMKLAECQRLTHTEMKEILQKNIINIVPTVKNRNCLLAINGSYHPQIPYIFAVCETSSFYYSFLASKSVSLRQSKGCENIDCWESQLTDASRLEILNILNTYRQSVARGSCGSWCRNNKRRLIYELRWYYFFELDSWRLMENCSNAAHFPLEQSAYKKEATRSFAVGDFVSTSFKVETGLQSEFRAKLWDLLIGNHLLDWNVTTGQFRRGLTNDVGCVYLVRRSVSMITGLGEDVKFGNVGYFGCYFGYESEKAIKESSKNANTTDANCKGIDSESSVRFDALYPSLCKEIIELSKSKSPAMTCQPNSSYHGDAFKHTCSESGSIQNTQTWSEKVNGLILKFKYVYWSDTNQTHSLLDDECNLPDPPKQNPTFHDSPLNETGSSCTCDHVVNVTTTTELCPGWSYNDSQLTSETRQRIVNSLNEARQFVARGNCSTKLCRPPCDRNRKTEYCNVIKLRWHWYLESKAAEKVQNCSTKYASSTVNYANSPFLESSFFEEADVVFDLPPEGQIKLPDKLVELFWTNGLNDWHNDGTFRRGSAAWIGCAIVVRPGQQIQNIRAEYQTTNGTATHMVCAYVSPDEDFISKPDSVTKQCCPTCTQLLSTIPCLLRTAKGVQPFPFLCSSTLLSEVITLNCVINECPQPAQPTNSSNEYLQKKIYSRKICKIAVCLYLLALSVLLLVLSLWYKYSVEKKKK